MNYPNLMDERRDKGGYSLWLHGTKEKLKDRSTNGCTAMDNTDVVRLDPYIKLWDTPIIIQEKLNLREVDASREEGGAFLQEIEGWRQTWSEKDLRFADLFDKAEAADVPSSFSWTVKRGDFVLGQISVEVLP
jgi:murein L,D-transpeptidase YafK